MVDSYLEAVRRSPDSDSAVDAVAALKDAYLSMGKSDLAIAKLTQIAEKYPKQEAGVRASFCIGEIYQSLGKEDEADKVFTSLEAKYAQSRSAVKVRDIMDIFYRKRAARLQRERDNDGALAARRKSYEYGRNLESLYILVNELLRYGKYDDVHEYVKQALHIGGGYIAENRDVFLLCDAMAYHKSGHSAGAIPLLKQTADSSQESIKMGSEELLKEIEKK